MLKEESSPEIFAYNIKIQEGRKIIGLLRARLLLDQLVVLCSWCYTYTLTLIWTIFQSVMAMTLASEQTQFVSSLCFLFSQCALENVFFLVQSSSANRIWAKICIISNEVTGDWGLFHLSLPLVVCYRQKL